MFSAGISFLFGNCQASTKFVLFWHSFLLILCIWYKHKESLKEKMENGVEGEEFHKIIDTDMELIINYVLSLAHIYVNKCSSVSLHIWLLALGTRHSTQQILWTCAKSVFFLRFEKREKRRFSFNVKRHQTTKSERR